MALNSTSIGWINGDKPLSPIQKIAYYALNWLNNVLPSVSSESSVAIKNFRCPRLRDRWHSLETKSSPSRKLSDLFWQELPWQKIGEELGAIHILDVGCGAGGYGAKLEKWSFGKISSYTGVDIAYHKNWPKLEEQNLNFKFRKLQVEDISNHIPAGTNFFMSQSAIEHFPQDLLFFQALRQNIIAYQKPVIQVHLFPSAACLRAYRLHGVRQYTPRTVGKITSLFRAFSYSTLFRLGGQRCNSLHYQFISKPLLIQNGVDWRESKTEEYEKEAFKAIERDMQNPSGAPSFYALVIHSYWRQKIIEQDAWPSQKLN